MWAIEAELTPKPLARTVTIMRALLARTSDYGPSEPAGPDSPVRAGRLPDRSARPAHRATGAINALPAPMQHRIVVRDLPPGATS